MEQTSHGGNIYYASRRMGKKREEFLDFSANINPLGIPDRLKELLSEGLEELTAYPDPDCTELREAVSIHTGVPSEQVIIGNGASEIIYLVLETLKPKKVLLPAPCFSEYAAAALRCGAQVVYLELKESESFQLDMGRLEQELSGGVDCILLCNPNNPTSRLIPGDQLKKLVRSTAFSGIQVIVDEAFIELTQDGGAQSVKELVPAWEHLFVIRAFTKTLAIPGLRLGYGLGGEKLIARMWRNKLPWSVNGLASCVGRFLLEDKSYMRQTIEWLTEEKEWLYRELCRLPHIQAYKPDSSFVLARMTGQEKNAALLAEKLAQNGILIRKAGNFMFLDKSYFRLAVKNHSSNIRLVAELQKILEQVC